MAARGTLGVSHGGVFVAMRELHSPNKPSSSPNLGPYVCQVLISLGDAAANPFRFPYSAGAKTGTLREGGSACARWGRGYRTTAVNSGKIYK